MNRTVFQIVLVIHTICAVFSVPLLVTVMLRLRRKQAMHRNTRMILFAHFLALFIYSLMRIILNTTTFLKFNVRDIPILRCSLRIPGSLASSMLYLSSFYIVIERCVAITNAKDYEKNRTVGIILVAAKLLTALGIFAGFHMPEPSYNGLSLFCSTSNNRSELFTLIPFITVMIFQAMSVTSIKFLKHINQRLSERQRQAPQLLTRYNLDESLRTLHVITPFIYTSCIFIFISMAFVTGCIAYRTHINPVVYYPLIEGLNWLPEYALLAPLILLCVDKKLRLKKKTNLQQLMIKGAHGDVGHIYFASLVSAWNNPTVDDGSPLSKICPRHSSVMPA